MHWYLWIERVHTSLLTPWVGSALLRGRLWSAMFIFNNIPPPSRSRSHRHAGRALHMLALSILLTLLTLRMIEIVAMIVQLPAVVAMAVALPAVVAMAVALAGVVAGVVAAVAAKIR